MSHYCDHAGTGWLADKRFAASRYSPQSNVPDVVALCGGSSDLGLGAVEGCRTSSKCVKISGRSKAALVPDIDKATFPGGKRGRRSLCFDPFSILRPLGFSEDQNHGLSLCKSLSELPVGDCQNCGINHHCTPSFLGETFTVRRQRARFLD